MLLRRRAGPGPSHPPDQCALGHRCLRPGAQPRGAGPPGQRLHRPVLRRAPARPGRSQPGDAPGPRRWQPARRGSPGSGPGGGGRHGARRGLRGAFGPGRPGFPQRGRPHRPARLRRGLAGPLAAPAAGSARPSGRGDGGLGRGPRPHLPLPAGLQARALDACRDRDPGPGDPRPARGHLGTGRLESRLRPHHGVLRGPLRPRLRRALRRVPAHGGLFLAGGIAAKNAPHFVEDPRFMARFERNYRAHLDLLTRATPVFLVHDYDLSLYGAAHAPDCLP
ncbi:MAG: glucokinase [Holophagaceae bacterium]|nr:glucokinase [Holophagaceae bacterium]